MPCGPARQPGAKAPRPTPPTRPTGRSPTGLGGPPHAFAPGQRTWWTPGAPSSSHLVLQSRWVSALRGGIGDQPAPAPSGQVADGPAQHYYRPVLEPDQVED